jgi:pimeloyl-ACP methyl ester carboxylesterase
MTTTFTANASGQYWTWRDQHIYYVHSGQNNTYPPLLLIHGFCASTDHWHKNIIELSRDFDVWAIDLLGFGRSAKPNWQFGGDLWREQLHDFINLVINRPTVLAGNSIGGYACLTVAAEYPESVAGVILLNSAGSFTDTNPLGAKKISPLQKAIRDISQSLLSQSLPSNLLFQFVKQRSQIRKTLLQVYVNKSAVTEELIANIQRPANDKGAIDVLRSVFSSPQGKKVDELLKTMTCPLLAIWGEADPWMSSQGRGAKFKEYYPSLTEHYIQSGHCPHDDTPELVNPIIREWLILANCNDV